MACTAGCMPCNSANPVSNLVEQSSPRDGWWLWSRNPLSIILWPLSLLFCALVRLRRHLYERGWLSSSKPAVPVVVVGNISLGGSGKTPVVECLVRSLKTRGYQPGILTRGYKSDLGDGSLLLNGGEVASIAGDEANMLSELCACPIAVGADRVASASALLAAHPEIDVLVTDDGLQHYALARDIEIIVRRDRALGNRWCLPAGPLREPMSRLADCDLLIDRDVVGEKIETCWNLAQPTELRALSDFAGQQVHALAGIGFPETFFRGLRDAGLEVTGHAFADHHEFRHSDLPQTDGRALFVTHKDAVKLRAIAPGNTWVVRLELELPDDLQYRFLQLVESARNG